MIFLHLTAAAFLVAPDHSMKAPHHSRIVFAVPIHIHHVERDESQIRTASNPLRTPVIQSFLSDWLKEAITLVPPAFAAEPPSNADVVLLNRAMSAFSRNEETATDLLTQTIAVWKDQPPDELATLYLLRAQSYMMNSEPEKARDDFSKAIPNLENDLATAHLGRARALRSLSLKSSSQPATAQTLAADASKDYQLSFQIASRDADDFLDTDQERQEDGASRNPYAAWEWGSSLRTAAGAAAATDSSSTSQYREAARVHVLASQAFDNIGDRGHAVISLLDAGIDMAAAAASVTTSGNNGNLQEAKELLSKGIALTTSVQGRDVALLQRVIAKEGEARVALASILWSSSLPGSKQEAEQQLGQACLRLEQLDQDAMERNAKAASSTGSVGGTGLKYSIDDQAGAFDINCARFKNDKFLSETLQWPVSLQGKVRKLIALE